jgi:apolipoprotein D and lipocalin family protein
MYCNLIILASFIGMCMCKEYKAVDELDLTKYVGKWYEVYQDSFNRLFQGDGRCSTAEYEIVENNKVSVFNKQIDKNNEYDTISGYAYYKDGDCCGYLTVVLKGTPEAPYWVLELGPEVDGYYDYSIVSDDKALSLFVLTRDVDRFYKLYDTQVLESLNDLGFNKKFNSPKPMNQTDCDLL